MQRSIICMMVIFGTLSGVYIIPTIYEEYSSLEHAAAGTKNSLADVSVPQPVDDADSFARNAISAIHRRAKELKGNSSVVSLYVFTVLTV